MRLASEQDAWKHGHSREPINDSDGRARNSANFCPACHNWFYPTPIARSDEQTHVSSL